MKDEISKDVKIAKTDDGRWLVRVVSDNGILEDEHILEAKPTVETVRALIQEAESHHEALERLVNR